MKDKKFSPLMFLASLGAGGITIIPFALLQYTFPHGKGLVKIADIGHANLPLLKNLFFYSLEGVMLFFTLLHIVLSVIFFKKLIGFIKNTEYKNFINDPLKNSAIMAPFISIVMTMNVMIGPIRFFIPEIAANLQTFMLPALIFWIFLFILHIRMEIKLLKISFEKGFDVDKISFGWLLHPFALAMLTVTGTGIAAMATSASIAHTAAFLSFISGSMGMFLFVVKTISIFKKHFNTEGLGDKQFLPSFLIVIPNVTLYAISAFRIGHYLERHHGFHLDSYFLFVIVGAFAFETWYLLFGITLLKDYFKRHHFNKEFFVSQWGLICPFVAYSVLGSFVYSVFLPSPIFYYTVLFVMIVTIVFYLDLLLRNMRCAGIIKGKIECDK
ncbi:MAG: hypothetical protein HOE80_04705 [Candidatus Magasanikbacteria bacterium]|jgi:hypothetical protein|nr:hypothetical protein [Candidatus Magasanikbacteria bacterium]MBT4071990.1 hypothetical protein [Candidatus Magasanikbacteria bacterium]